MAMLIFIELTPMVLPRWAALQMSHPGLRPGLHPAVQPAATPPQPREPTREALRNAAATDQGTVPGPLPRTHSFGGFFFSANFSLFPNVFPDQKL